MLTNLIMERKNQKIFNLVESMMSHQMQENQRVALPVFRKHNPMGLQSYCFDRQRLTQKYNIRNTSLPPILRSARDLHPDTQIKQ